MAWTIHTVAAAALRIQLSLISHLTRHTQAPNVRHSHKGKQKMVQIAYVVNPFTRTPR